MSFLDDPVNHPSHYTSGKIECIEYIKDTLNNQEYAGYLRGNLQKYISRYPLKNGIEDLRKARWYLDALIEHLDDTSPQD